MNAVVRGVVLESGAWGRGWRRAAHHRRPDGRRNFAAGASVGGGAATLSGIQTQVVLLPSGRVQTDIGNFGTGVKLYGWVTA